MTAPIPGSYWVSPGRLLAGAYPAPGGEAEAREALRRLGEAGVTVVVDLTEEGEYGLPPYTAHLKGMRAARRSIADFSAPSAEEMREILDLLDAELDAGGVVYIHCYGGRGRTGTVVGCHLVRQGQTGEEALATIARLRAEAGCSGDSPETDEQRALVLGWERSA
jgi:polymorphic toxin system DSP-PTPase phosphatase-like protein